MLTSFAIFLVVAYGATLLAVYVFQGRLIYPAPPARSDAPYGFAHMSHPTPDGLTLDAGYLPARDGMPTLLFFHGNGASWQTTPYVTGNLVARGYGVLAAEYRGYNGNPGSPSEKGLYEDARGAFAFLREQGIAPRDIVLVGNSIGSGVATHLATEVEARALVLISPFDSLEQTASRRMRWLPVRQLLRDRYDNSGKFPHLTLPILILHGEDDSLIAVEQARSLAQAHPDTRLVTYPGWGHDLVVHEPVQDEIAEFLESR